MTGGSASIMVVAGEASGDLHGASLCRELAELRPGTRLFGMGGSRMAAEGFSTLADVTRAAAVGWSEAVGRVPALLRTFRCLGAALRRERPAALVLIDFPEFNLRLARVAREAGVPVVYFLPPQIWAWRAGRVRAMRRRVALVLTALPFEAAIYRAAGVPVTYVGHPVLDAVAAAPSRAEARERLGLFSGDLVIGLLPGSRREEIARMWPAMREAAARVAREWPDARFVLGLAPTVSEEAVRDTLAGPAIRIVGGQSHAVMRAADLLLATSGTATLEAAVLGTPMIVCYQLSRLSAAFTRCLIRVPWISLVNLILGRAAVPELYQEAASGPALGEATVRLLADPGARERQQSAFREMRGMLGSPGVGRRAAELVLAAGHLR